MVPHIITKDQTHRQILKILKDIERAGTYQMNIVITVAEIYLALLLKHITNLVS